MAQHYARKQELVRTEMAATLERFGRYLTGTRFDRRRKLRATTARTYLNRMGLFMEWAGTLDPTVAQAQAYLAHMAEDYRTVQGGKPPSDSTKRAAFFVFRAWFEWKRRPITNEEAREFLVPPSPRTVREMPLDLERIHELLSRIPDRRRYAIVRTLLATGIRRAELAALKVKHVDFEARRLWVPEIGEDGRAAAKGGSGGFVCISQVALDAIREHLASRAKPSGADPEAPLFESLQTYEHLTPDAVTDIVGNLTTRILGKRVSPHAFRHAFASHCAAGGEGRPPMPIVALQRQLRHRNLETTLRYVREVGALEAAYERSAPVF
jgi:integrase